jgi:hypothetical protein
MARKKSEGSTKKITPVKDFVTLDQLPEVLKTKFNSYRLSEHSIDWAMRVAAGESPMDVTADLYSIDEKALIKQKTKQLLSNPKIQQLVKTLRDHLKHETYINYELILRRMEMLYTEATYDNNDIMALNVLKEMAKIIKDNSGNITVTDVTIKFEMPNKLKVNNSNIEDANIVENGD